MSLSDTTDHQDDNSRECLAQEAASILASLTKRVPMDVTGNKISSKDPPCKTSLESSASESLALLNEVTKRVTPIKADHDRLDMSSENDDGHVASKRGTGNGFAKIFPEKLLEILEHCTPKDDDKSSENHDHSNCIAWLPHGKAFVITDIVHLTLDVLPLFFSNKNSTETKAARAEADNNSRKVKAIAEQKFKSFTRKLYRWGFRQVTRGPDTGSYAHPLFRRNQRELCLRMKCHYSELELKVQKENAARAEERRKVMNSKDKQVSHPAVYDIIKPSKITVPKARAENDLSHISGSTSVCDKAVIPGKLSSKYTLDCLEPSQNFRLGNRFYSTKSTFEKTPNPEGSLKISGHLLGLDEQSGQGGEPSSLLGTRALEDPTVALADAVLRNQSIEKVILAHREIELRKQQAVFLQQRAKRHLAAAAAAAEEASRLATPNQFTLPLDFSNPLTSANLVNTPGTMIDMDSRRRALANIEKQLLLSNAFKQSYQSQTTDELHQRLQVPSQTVQLALGKPKFMLNGFNPSGLR